MVKINKEKTKEEYKKLIEEYIKFCDEERYQIRLKKTWLWCSTGAMLFEK